MLRRIGACVFALLWICLWAGDALARKLAVRVDQFRPTQVEIGRKVVDDFKSYWKGEARRRGVTLRKYAETVLASKWSHEKVPAVVDHTGRVRNTDAHHRLTALSEISRETGVPLKVQADILKDYRGRTEAEFANHFVNKLDKGYFGARTELKQLSPIAKMRMLPKTFAGMKNNPMRTAVGMVFDKHKISGEMMKDYAEFRAGEKLLDKGLMKDLRDANIVSARAQKLPARLASDPRVLTAIEDRLGKKSMRKYLLGEAKNGDARRKLKQIIKRLD